MTGRLKQTIVKVQTDHRGSRDVLIYGEGHTNVRHQRYEEVAREMGPLKKRYYFATFYPATDSWALATRAPDQEW